MAKEKNLESDSKKDSIPLEEEVFDLDRDFMKDVFEDDSIVPLREPLVNEENLFVHCLCEEQSTLVNCKGIKVKKDCNFLRRQQKENEKFMREVEELAQNLSPLPSNTQFEYQNV